MSLTVYWYLSVPHTDYANASKGIVSPVNGTSQWEKKVPEGFVEINSEWKGNRGAESWQRDQRERWWRWYGRFTQITHVVFVSSADILRYSSLIFVPQPNGMEVISILSGFKVLPMKIVDRVVCGFSRITSIFPLERQVVIQIININIYLFLKKVSALNNIPFTSVALGKQQIDRKPKVSLW